jgi:aspartyl/asparaginyl beta-hydroxylase (cupin superfamily)
MVASLLSPKLIFGYVLVASALAVHLRGRVRYGFFRQLIENRRTVRDEGLQLPADGCVRAPTRHRDIGFRDTAIRASQTGKLPGDRLGPVDRAFAFACVCHVRLFGKRIKERGRAARCTLKWLLTGALVAALIAW